LGGNTIAGVPSSGKLMRGIDGRADEASALRGAAGRSVLFEGMNDDLGAGPSPFLGESARGSVGKDTVRTSCIAISFGFSKLTIGRPGLSLTSVGRGNLGL
jgi:hypothetical protein